MIAFFVHNFLVLCYTNKQAKIQRRKGRDTMDEKISFSILEIEETKDKQAIQDAYRRLLVKVNPEDDPEGFKRLREAYEAAAAYAEQPEALKKTPETPLEFWMDKVKKVYFSLSHRLDLECWKEILQDELCLDLDTSMEARDTLLGFLADSYRVTTDVWKMIDKTFNLQEEREELMEKFHPNFIDFVMHQCQSNDNFPFELFEGADDADYDTFLYHYYDLCRQIDGRDLDAAEKTLETLEHLPVEHPYLELEQARYDRCRGNGAKAAERIHRLLEILPEDIRLLVYGGEIFWENGEKELSAQCFEKVLKDCDTHYMANKYTAMYYQEKKEYEKAKEYCVEALRVSSQEEALLECMHGINEELIRIYEERAVKGEISDDDLMELGWCYLQNEQPEKGVTLLEGRTVADKHAAELHNLRSKFYFVVNRFADAAEEAKKCIPLIEIEAKAREDEAEEDKKGEQQERIPGRIAAACEIIAKSLHMLAKEEGLPKEEKASCLEQAMEAIDEALKNEPENRGYRIEKVQILMDEDSYEKAIDICDAMIKTDREDFYAYVLRQKCCYEMHNGQGVVDNFYDAKNIYAGYPEIYELAADVFIRYSQYEDAKGILKQAEEAQVGSPKLDLIKLTIQRETAEKEEECQDAYTMACELLKKFREHADQVSDKDMAEMYYEIARCSRGIDQHQEALKYIQEACRLHMDKLYRWIRANTLADLKEYDKAMEDYLICAKEYGDNEVVYENMARCYENMGNWRKAVYYLKKTLKVNPENPRANSRIVDVLTDRLKATGNREYYSEALPFATRQLELKATAYYYIERGLLHMEASAWKEAEEDFVKAAELEPDNTFAYNNRGCIYKYLEQYDKALELFRKAVEVMEERETLIPYTNSANCYERMCDYQKALEWYEKGSQLFPKNRSLRKDIIRVYKKMGLLEKALEEARNFYGSDTAQFLLEAGDIYVQMKRFDKGISMYQAARKKGGEDEADAISRIGDVYLYYKKKTKKALELYLKALALTKQGEGNYDYYCRRVMECYHELGRPDEGIPYQKLVYESWIARYGSIDNYLQNFYYRKTRLYSMGSMYYYIGDLEKAREYLEQIGQESKCRHCSYKECEDYWEAMGFLREAEGNLAEALECYGKACKESKANNLSIAKVEKLTKLLQKQSRKF